MSDNKRYFWFKMSEDFFKDRRIKRLRKLAGGDTFTIIYQKMLLLTLKNNGLYEIGEYEELSESLALDIEEDIDNIKITLEFLKSCNLLVENSDKTVFFTDVENLVGSETGSARRMRKSRASKKIASQCDSSVTQCDSSVTQSKSIELDQDIDQDIDQEREKEKEEKIHSHLSTSSTGTLSPDTMNEISDSSSNTLTDGEYLALTSVFGKVLVDQKIANAKKYKNCMNFKTLRKWCNEELEREVEKDMQNYGY